MVNNIYNRILIIDDDEDLSFIISDMLESYGYNVTCAENSEKAFELLESNTYHIILLDINLPDSDGFEICCEVSCYRTFLYTFNHLPCDKTYLSFRIKFLPITQTAF